MKMADKVPIEKIEKILPEIKAAAIDFKNRVAEQVKDLKDLKAEIKDWRFGVESHEEDITIDIGVKVLLKPKSKT